jgi:DNA repair exonuclease SbcCD ATPase subunit
LKLLEEVAEDAGPFRTVLLRLKEQLYEAIFSDQRITSNIHTNNGNGLYAIEPLPYLAVVQKLDAEKREILTENESLQNRAKQAENKASELGTETTSLSTELASIRQAKHTLKHLNEQMQTQLEELKREKKLLQDDLTDQCLVLHRSVMNMSLMHFAIRLSSSRELSAMKVAYQQAQTEIHKLRSLKLQHDALRRKFEQIEKKKQRAHKNWHKAGVAVTLGSALPSFTSAASVRQSCFN